MVSAGKNSLKVINRSRKKKHVDLKRKKSGFDSDCFQLRKEVRSLGRALHRNPNNQYLRDKFLFQSKQYKRMLKRKERAIHTKLVNDLCSEESKNPKHFWQLINKMKSKQSNPADDISPVDWLKHFKSLYCSPPDHSLQTDILALENNSPSDEYLNRPFTISEVKTVLKGLKNNKSACNDLISNEMLKSGSSILLPSMCKLFNLILDSGVFPAAWNISFQVPIFKAGDPTECTNYRGIAINSCLGKVFSGVLQSRLLTFVKEHNLLKGYIGCPRNCPRQCSFINVRGLASPLGIPHRHDFTLFK